jgi:hypothetical protein
MRMKSEKCPKGLFLRVATGTFLCLGVMNPARPQAPAPQPAPAAQITISAISVEPATVSLVFPDGGFPAKPAAEGDIPGTTAQPSATAQPGPGGLYAALLPPDLSAGVRE